MSVGKAWADWVLPSILSWRIVSAGDQVRVRRDSRLGLDFSHFSVHISHLGLVSVSKNHVTDFSVSSRSQKSFYRILGLVSVSKNHFTEFSVLSRSRKIILQNSRSRLGLVKQVFQKSRLVSSLGFFFKFREVFFCNRGYAEMFLLNWYFWLQF